MSRSRTLCAVGLAATLSLSPMAHSQERHAADMMLSGMADMYSPAVVRLGATSAEGEAVSGNAFFIGPGELIAPRDLLMGASDPMVIFDSGQKLSITKVLDENEDANIVLAYVDVPPALRRGLQVSRLEAIPGERALFIAAPITPADELPEHPLAEVRIGEPVRPGEHPPAALTGEITQDFKGSPGINISGQVVGVAVVREGEVVAVPPTLLLDLDESFGLEFSRWAAGESLDAARETAQAARLDPANLPRPEGYPPPPEMVGEIPVVPSGIERQPDGSLLFDSRYLVTGSGTKADPYVVPWELLVSVEETYSPRKGKKKFPERVAMLDGKHVIITGHASFPLQMDQPDEMLLAYNPWDGCCIGVPPTAFDAVEVGLIEPLMGVAAHANYGSITGVLTVDPYIVGQWLVGLYLMEEATFKPGSFEGFGW